MFKTEAEFIARLQSGDSLAYEMLIEQYADMVYRVAYRILQNEHDAEDALQETFLTVYRRINSFRNDAKFSSWLYRVATNISLDIIRAKQRKHGDQTSIDILDDEEETRLIDDTTPLPEQVLLQQETAAELQRGLAALSPKLRAAFVLFELEGLSMRETAQTLEISESAAKLRVHRARIELQKWLVEQTKEVQI